MCAENNIPILYIMKCRKVTSKIDESHNTQHFINSKEEEMKINV